MAKVGDRIAKVVCKRCGNQHLYRPEAGTASANGTSGRSNATPRRAAPKRAPEPTPQPLPAFDPSRPPVPYSPASTYPPGDRVAHQQFGVGVVVGSPGPGKVEIAFPSGRRVLAAAKAASTLGRPVQTRDVPIADRPPQSPSQDLPEDH